jgi:AcrR family transcriptional regulator
MRSFHDRGYAATTVADIVAGTDYTSGAFYFHFTDKAECFWTVIEQREQRRGPWWDSVLADLDPGRDSIEDVLEAVFAHFAAEHGEFNEWVLAMLDFHQHHRSDPDAQARLAAVYARWREELVQFVTALAERGWVAADRDPTTVATQLFAFREGLTTHARVYGLPPEQVRAALIDGLARLLR